MRIRFFDQYKRIDDIPLPDKDIESKVQRLVRGLTSIGLDPHASCQGHLERSHHHPWAGLNPFAYEIKVLEYLLKEYNHTHDVKWEFDLNWIRPTMAWDFSCCAGKEKVEREKLMILQDSSDSLGQLIFDYSKYKEVQEMIHKYDR